METSNYRDELTRIAGELESLIARAEQDAREAAPAEVGDPIDMVTGAEAKAAGFALSSEKREKLAEVRRALGRLDDGTYGVCKVCGRDIEPARLRAVPWTRYCLADQARLDAQSAPPPLDTVS